MSAPRGVHLKPKRGTSDYEHGQKQAAMQLKYYHWLCAAIQKKFTIVQSRGMAGVQPDGTFDEAITLAVLAHRPLCDVTFSQYKDFQLQSIERIKIDVRENGAAHPEDLEFYHRMYKDDTETREGGVLCCTSMPREFWTIMLSYHAIGETGSAEWDELFARLKAEGFPKGIIPCRYFTTQAGCCDGECPFLHDQEAASKTREDILKKRRKTFDYKHKPTPQQSTARFRLLLNQMAGPSPTFEQRETLMPQVDEIMKGDRAYCANPECMKPWKEGEPNPLQNCSRCKFTMYCSSDCQKKDWQRHKKEPCATIEELVHNDALWNPIGTRKGTERFPVNWGDA